LTGALNLEILNVTFTGMNGLTDYGEQSTNVYVAYCNFASLTGTAVSLPDCVNVTYVDNIGYPTTSPSPTPSPTSTPTPTPTPTLSPSPTPRPTRHP
jgi:hypothetical protein